MSDMTPDQARRVLDDHDAHSTPIRPTDAQQALETIAAHSVEYRTEAYAFHDEKWFPITHWAPADTPPTSKGWNIYPVRIMARHVSTPWEVEE